MKLLLDANISWRLVKQLKIYFEDCIHIDSVDLSTPPPVKDTDIWNYALTNEWIIVTNDKDFLNFSNLKGFPPKIILLRTGNQSTDYIESLLIKHKPDIETLNNSTELGLLEIF